MTGSRTEDWIAVRELTARYNRALDDGRPEDWADTFLESGGLYLAATDRGWVGRSELMAFASSKPWGSMHVTSDADVDIDGDTAQQVCSLVMFRRSPERTAPTLIATGRYNDLLRRTPQGWRFESRVVWLDADISTPGITS